MRYWKDSFIEINPRARFWNSQIAAQKRHRLMPFSLVKPLFNWQERTKIFYYANFMHWNTFFEGISVYVPRRLKLHFWGELVVFLGFFALGSAVHHFETKLWKEKKWEKDPGCVIPFRKPALVRFYNWLVEVKIKSNLYYIGLFTEDKDLEPHLDLQQFVEGRKYRRFLIAEYSRRNFLSAQRNESYDFLEISPMYGKDSA